MLNIVLIENGLDDTIKEIKNDLKSVLGKTVSKRRKDEMIYKTLGAITTLYNMTMVIDVDEDADKENT